MPNYSFVVDGKSVTVDAPPEMPLLWVLRDLLGMTGVKFGCGLGDCRACTSHLNGAAVATCQVPIESCDGQTVTTIEGLANGDTLHPVQEAWIAEDVPQCGFCQPGQIMAAVDLLNRTNNNPTDADIDGIANICRCGTYGRIRRAIKRAAGIV
jgi:isoquinoline 1-oxidoreductase alpha subunit